MLESTTKKPYEKYFIHADFSEVLGGNETISTVTLSAVDKTGNDATNTVIETGTNYTADTKHYLRIQNGDVNLSPYTFTVKIETSSGNKWRVDGDIIIS